MTEDDRSSQFASELNEKEELTSNTTAKPPVTLVKKRTGPPRKLLSPQQIIDLEHLAETGATRAEQAAYLGMDSDTLSRRIKDQPDVFRALARAGARMKTSIRRKQVAVALNDKHPAQATMLIWLGKAVLGQSEKVTLKIETAFDALARLKEAWPEIPEDELIKQLTAGDSSSGVIDVEGHEVEEAS